MNDDYTDLRVADDEPCYHNKVQRDCWYFKAHNCHCNRPGDGADGNHKIDGIPVEFVRTKAELLWRKARRKALSK